jgi:hypothetical protein
MAGALARPVHCRARAIHLAVLPVEETELGVGRIALEEGECVSRAYAVERKN